MKKHTDFEARHSSTGSARHAAIATLAYDLWFRAGQPGNRALDHWLEAERTLAYPPDDGLEQPLLPVDF